MRSISIQFKDSVVLPLFVVAFFLFVSTIPSYAAEPDTSQTKDCKLHGFTEGVGEVAAGTVKGTDETLQGFGQGFQGVTEGFGRGVEESVNGFAGGTGKVLEGIFGGKSKSSSESKSEETAVK